MPKTPPRPSAAPPSASNSPAGLLRPAPVAGAGGRVAVGTGPNTAGDGVSEGVGVGRGVLVPVAVGSGVALAGDVLVAMGPAVDRMGLATGATIDDLGTGLAGVLTTAGGSGVAVGIGVIVGGAGGGAGVYVAVGTGRGVLVYSRVAVGGIVAVGVDEGQGVQVGYGVQLGVGLGTVVGVSEGPGVTVPVIWKGRAAGARPSALAFGAGSRSPARATGPGSSDGSAKQSRKTTATFGRMLRVGCGSRFVIGFTCCIRNRDPG